MELRKRIKLSAIQPERASQESKVTSTPRTTSPVFSLSPSISSIENEEFPMEIDSDIENDGSSKILTSSDSPSFLGDSLVKSTERRRRKPIKITWVGFWSSLKPKNKDSLYYKIMTQPEATESFAIDVLNNDERGRIILILQLFVDLCGYKKLSLAKVYEFDKQNAKQVIDKMESQLMETELKKTGKFLFMKCSKFGNLMESIIADFVKHLVLKSFETDILFDEIFIGHILEFINCMSFSSVRCIRVTGVVLVTKLLTAFVNLYSQFLALVQDENSNSTIENMDEKKTALETFIDFLYLIYDKNCLIPDKKCYVIKVKCAQEMLPWIKLFPNIFIFKRKCLGRLMKLVLDHNEIVRQSAITTCEKLISCEAIEKDLKERIDLCLKVISTRILDTNYKVAIKAVTIFTAALDRYFERITKAYKFSIICRMYEKNGVLAKAAGQFLAAYIQHLDKDDEQILLYLVKIAFFKKEFAERLPFFIEACINDIPQLKDWPLFINILLDGQILFQTRKHLLQILHEVVRFTLTGKFSKSRQNFVQAVPPNSEDHVAVADVIIPNFENMAIQFQTDKYCLKYLIEILMFIDYDVANSNALRKHFLAVLNLLKDLFGASADKNLLENITSAFSCFCSKQCNIRAEAVVAGIKNNYAQRLNDDLKQLTPTSERNLLLSLRETSMKISILFAKFDLTGILKWEDIFQIWDSNYLKVLKYLIICCKWHLVWRLRHFIKASTNGDNNGRGNHLLYNNCKDFVCGCLEMLQHTNGTSEYFLIFEALCDMYICFEKELKRKREFSNFLIKIAEPEILLNFVVRHVIENTNLHLDQRQGYLNKLVDVMYIGALPVEHFSTIMRYYHTHYQEFGPVMDAILQQLNLSHPALPLLIVHTLTQIFNQILDKYKVVNILSDESKQLKHLAKKFASVKEMKSPNDILKLVHMSIYFAFRNSQNYTFLYYARYFARRLSESGKSDAYHLFSELVPEKDKDNDILLLFASILKASK